MSKGFREALKILFFFGLGIGITAWVWYRMSPEEKAQFWDAVQRARYIWLFFGLALGALAHVSRALRWRLILDPVGYKPRVANLFFAVMNMYFFNMFVPRLGEVTRCAALQQYEKIPFEKTLGTVVVERAIDLIMLIIVFGLTCLLQMDNINEIFATAFKKDSTQPEPGFFMKNLKFFILGFIMLVVGLLYLLRKVSFFAKIFNKVRTIGKGIWEGLKSITKVKNVWEFLFHTVFIWVMYFLMTYVSFKALPETAGLSWLAPLSVLVFGSVAIMFTPNGLGAFPLVVSGLLAIPALGAINGGTASALGWLIWGGQTVLILTLGVASLVAQPIYNREK